MFTAPFAVSQILQHADSMQSFESVKGFMIGGGVASESMCKSLQVFLPNGKIWANFGCSECGFLTDSFKVSRFGSCGVPSQNVQIKIMDEDGRNLGPNHTGEICVRTKVLFSGYFGDPQATAETVVNGWIHLGDVGHFDDDGFLFIVGRQKEMLKYNGFQVYPSELEMIIDEIEGVKNSCVVGVTRETDSNDLVFAFVVKDTDAEDLREVDIENYVNERVIDAKRLRGGVHFVDAIPLTPSGKVLRRKAKEMAIKIHRSKSL